MTAPLRFLAALALLTAGLVGVYAKRPDWLRQTGRFDPNYGMMILSPPPSETLTVARRIKAKTAVIEKLRAGELTLFEAAAWFRHLSGVPFAGSAVVWERMPGDTHNEKICRQVIRWAEIHLDYLAPKSEVAAVTSRLEEELLRHLAEHNGEVVLPGFEQE